MVYTYRTLPGNKWTFRLGKERANDGRKPYLDQSTPAQQQ